MLFLLPIELKRGGKIKDIYKKIIPSLIICVMLLSTVGMQIKNVEANDNEQQEKKLIDRGLLWNRYKNNNNVYSMEIFTTPINYQDEQGNWKPINIELKNENGKLVQEESLYKLEIWSNKSGYTVYPDRNNLEKYIDFYMPDIEVDNDDFYKNNCNINKNSVKWNFDNFAIEILISNEMVKFLYTLKDDTIDHEIDMKIAPHNCEIDNNGYIIGFKNWQIINIIEDSSNPPKTIIPDYTYNQETDTLSISINNENLEYPLILDPSLVYLGSTDDKYISTARNDYFEAHNASNGAPTTSEQNYVGQNKYWHQYYQEYFYRIYRSFVFFNTSSIPNNAILNSANLSLYGIGSHDFSDTDFSIVLQYNTTYEKPLKPPVRSDYNYIYYSGDLGSFYTSNWNDSDYNLFIINSSGLNSINKTGISRYCIRSSHDIDFESPTGSEYLAYYNGYSEGTTQDPKLIVYYTLPSWWNSSWEHRKKITINGSCINENLTNFPVLVNLSSDSDLASYAQSDGDDICFVDSSDENQYNHEIEIYNNSTGRLVAWVNITEIDSSDSTEFYMYFGNNECSNQENVNDTWNADYKFVCHMGETLTDSTSNGVTFTNSGTTLVESNIGYGRDFEQTEKDYIVTDYTTQDSDLTASVYHYTETYEPVTYAQCIITKHNNNGDNDYGSWFFTGYDGSYYLSTTNDGTTSGNANLAGTHTFSAGDYHLGTFRFDDTANKQYILIDGTNYNYSTTQSQIASKSVAIYLGTYENFGNPHTNQLVYFDGVMDEVRYSSVPRSDAWLNAEYESYTNASFVTIGSLES